MSVLVLLLALNTCVMATERGGEGGGSSSAAEVPTSDEGPAQERPHYTDEMRLVLADLAAFVLSLIHI